STGAGGAFRGAGGGGRLPAHLHQAAGVFAEAPLRLGAKHRVGAGAVQAQVAFLVALQGQLIRHAPAGPLPDQHAAGDRRVGTAVGNAVAVWGAGTLAIRPRQDGENEGGFVLASDGHARTSVTRPHRSSTPTPL